MSQYPPYPPAGYPPRFPQPSPSGATAYTAAGAGVVLAIACAWGAFVTFGAVSECVGRCVARSGASYPISIACAVGLSVSALLLLVGAALIFARQTAGAVLTAVGAFLPSVTAVLFFLVPNIRIYVAYLDMTAVVVLIGLTALFEMILSLLPPTFAFLRHTPHKPHFPGHAPYGQYPPPGYGPH
ncbi:hypothetical protein [Actinokineospora spheciospongiae]|uniref:hypothetical protein n=1 Tax=Actinokineospora spheciospongiae TaxID=909613 RepID=UPI000D713C59|nr:hypothetical protein [Actinokineospora spheciospongiae]PWW63299.1 hypothetical protein DFQ13_104289 [Actinokineospora spheciospongiae]